MALPGLKKLNPKKSKRLRKEPFRPLGPGIKNQAQLREAIRKRTEGAVRPKLQAFNRQGLEEKQAHTGRMGDLRGMYDYYGDTLQDAFGKAQAALDDVLATTTGSNESAQSTMLAALERSREADRSQAETVGGVLPEGLGDDVAAMAAGAGDASTASLANTQSQAAQLAAGRIGTAGLARTRAMSDEQQRFNAIRQQLQKERQGVKQTIPAVREEMRKNVLDEELAKATERSRQKLAREGLKLEKRKTGNEEREGDRNNALNWAQLNLEKQKLHTEVTNAGSDAAREKAEARAAQYESGVQAFTEYLNSNKKDPNPREAYRLLLLSVPRPMALKIMRAGPTSAFRNFSPGGNGNSLKKKPPSVWP